MKTLKTSRMWWLTLTAVLLVGEVTARDSRKEAQLPVQVGVNLLEHTSAGQLGYTRKPQGHHDAKGSDVIVDYDYFMQGLPQEGDPFFGLDHQLQSTPEMKLPGGPHISVPSSKHNSGAMSHDRHYDDYIDDAEYDYRENKHSHGSSKQDRSNISSLGHHDQNIEIHDPFSVFYDSLFPEEESVIPEENSVIPEEEPIIPVEEIKAVSENVSQRLELTTREETTTSLTESKIPTTTSKPSPPQDIISLTPQILPTIKSTSPNPKLQEPSKFSTQPSLPLTTPLNLTNMTSLLHLKAMMPALLEKFGLPKSLTDQLFQDEEALTNTLKQIIQDDSVRNVMSTILKLDLANLEFASIPGILSSLDLSVLLRLLRGSQLSRLKDLVSGLGFDTSYLKGIFSRAGAAQYTNTEAGDGGKVLYLPIVESVSVNNVQLLGFVIVVLFVLATTFAYLERKTFFPAKSDKSYRPELPYVNQHDTQEWDESDDHWISAVEATETPPHHWHIFLPSHEDVITRQPQARPENPVAPQRSTRRPSYPEEQQTHYAAAQPAQHRRPHPSAHVRRRHHPKERPTRVFMDLSPQNLRRLTHPQPSVRPHEPVDNVDRRYYSSYEHHSLHDEKEESPDYTFYESQRYHPSHGTDDISPGQHPNHQYHGETVKSPHQENFHTSPILTPSTWRPRYISTNSSLSTASVNTTTAVSRTQPFSRTAQHNSTSEN